MPAPEKLRVNRWLVAACVVMWLTAAAHAIGHLTPIADDPATRALVAAMRGHTLDLGLGMTPSQWDVTNALSLTMTVCLGWLGGVGLLIAYSDMGRRTVQRATIVFLVGNGILVALYLHYQLLPPLVALGAVELLLLAAVFRAPR